ncbi:hypothetical protein [Azospirillum sp. TSH58]|nr:hypothetical protein [Azospirillum sp. TSH58]
MTHRAVLSPSAWPLQAAAPSLAMALAMAPAMALAAGRPLR